MRPPRLLLTVFVIAICSARLWHTTVGDESSSELDVGRGHLKPFGFQRDPTETTEELDYVPHPVVFYEKYVKPHKPVVFRGAAKMSQAYHLWTEDYIKKEYGNLTVRLEGKSEGDSRVPRGEGGILGRDTLDHFMRNYQSMNAYVISQVPGPMEKDVAIPRCLLCGSFAKSIQEVHLFMSAGGGRTLIHQDPYENVHCVFNGTKEWLLIDPKQSDLVYLSRDSLQEFGGYSEVNIDTVDLTKFPKIKDVKFSHVTMNKGDCIYMPSGYLHQVRSNGYMNSAVAIWFSFFTKTHQFDSSDCMVGDSTESLRSIDFKPMSQVDVLWKYDGYSDLNQGHMDIYVLRTVLLTSADEDGKIWLEPFTVHFIQVHDDKEEDDDDDVSDEVQFMREQFIHLLDPDGRGYVTVEEINSLTIDQLKMLLLTFDPTDVSNTVEFEYSHISFEEIINLAENC
ncbi:bifunctional peptidase and (3S)-lysyl hydroxylase Jmjd7-like [Ptychodera flava]|uniref:bifunctional peptidase and (3S)-lysyl hydroxylase Jmjd7-like n=1 Tax=Ptychodera flava TaxID=63121 RepID=UPI00396A687F